MQAHLRRREGVHCSIWHKKNPLHVFPQLLTQAEEKLQLIAKPWCAIRRVCRLAGGQRRYLRLYLQHSPIRTMQTNSRLAPTYTSQRRLQNTHQRNFLARVANKYNIPIRYTHACIFCGKHVPVPGIPVGCRTPALRVENRKTILAQLEPLPTSAASIKHKYIRTRTCIYDKRVLYDQWLVLMVLLWYNVMLRTVLG